ncbi:thiamine pyrophosphate-binding protein [Modestobacter sp. VKM Ac-2986]|uniref:thiamine pyrophosphate-binding protein n=1 Tax=Modestobacter sp. VKM Ac-2986 TaxID=3004140 RepID=UPI0022AB0D81|nr:thiamine pyrophosphate-binding protein [Modestobacter sp. VKM Ac-2986]MCZ2827568.1 thiamine pyrophosphate-binding protein [Modestobacter sp. VKM Ac-2986]
MSRPPAEALLDVIRDWGADKLFTCPGSTEAAVLDALVTRRDVELVLTTHEGVAVSMADGLARVTRAPSVAYLHANVGLTNGLSHLYAAQLAYSPVVVLNGIKASSIQAREGFTTGRRMRDLVHQYVKSDWQSLTTEAVPEDVNRAFRTAVTEPAGPVWVALAQDLLESGDHVDPPAVRGFQFDSRTAPSPDAVERAAELIAAAERPLLVAGSEVGRAGAVEDLVALAEQLGAPVVHEDRRGFERPGFPTDHRLFRGQYEIGHPLVQQADLLVFLGARVFNEFEPAKVPPLPPGVPLVHSHTDPRHIGMVHGVTAGLVGDQRLVLRALAAALPATTAREAPPAPPVERRPTTAHGAPLHPADVVDVIAESLHGTALVGDATTAGGILQQRAHQHTGDDYFVSTSGSLGWGMGAALGIAMGMPGRQVAAVLGDGVFQFGMPALWSAARSGLPVTYVVMNNQSYAAVGAALRRFGGVAVQQQRWPGVDIAGPRIADVSTAFGVPGQRVDSLADLRECLDRSRRADHPTLVEVMTDPAQFGP